MGEKRTEVRQKDPSIADIMGGNVDDEGGATHHGKPVMEQIDETDNGEDNDKDDEN